MRRGEVWWAEQPEPIGRRPVLLLSRNEAYQVRNAVTVAQITTTIRRIPVEVSLVKSEGLPQECVVNLDTVATIPKNYLRERLSALNTAKMDQVNRSLKFALALP